jgi:hypothetical protein
MDPTGYGQTPPPPPPPPDWSQPGQPVPPAPFGQPSPYGQPAEMWAAPPPARRSRLPLIIVGIVVVVVIAFAAVIGMNYLKNVADRGKVVFSTDKPVAGQTVGCSVDHQVTSIAAGTPIYATYVFSARQDTDVVSLAVTKDGAQYLPATAMPTSDTKGLDCFADTTDLSTIFTAGTYTFTLTNSGGTIAQGTLTVTP